MRTAMYKLVTTATCLGLFVAAGCGRKSDDEDRRTEQPTIPQGGGGGGPTDPTDEGENNNASGIVRGRWMIDIEAGQDADGQPVLIASEAMFASKGTSSHPISATVAAAVTFTVDAANFQSGAPADGLVSFGSLDVTALRDNALRVCGTGGNQRCATGTVRMYTTGTAGAGLYSTAEGYGLPIKSGANTVGLGAANAATAATTTIANNMRVLKLNNFTTATKLVIPVSVDFTDAAASSYASTLVVEYVVE